MAKISPELKMKALQRNSAFVWSNRVELVKHIAPVSEQRHDEIMLNIQRGMFSEKDFFILKCLYQIGVINMEGLTNFVLAKVKNARPLEAVMSADEVTYLYIKKRLESYARQGLIGHYRFKIDGESVDYNDSKFLSMFFVTYEGFLAVKSHYRLADYHMFDSELIYLPAFEIFQRVAAKRCCTAFARRTGKVELFGEYIIPIKRDESVTLYGKWRHEKVYSSAIVHRDGNKPLKLFFEPMFFNVDPKICSEDNNLRHNHARLSALRQIVNDCLAVGEDAVLVIVVENVAGLQKFVDMIKGEANLSFFLERCFFTSDTVTCELMRDDVDGALLKMVIEDKQIKFVSEGAV